MDVVKAVETYISKMVSEPSAMKVLLLDSHTVSYVYLSRGQRAHRAVDTNRLVSSDAVDASLSSGVPYGPDRQQEARPHGAHEVCLLSEA